MSEWTTPEETGTVEATQTVDDAPAENVVENVQSAETAAMQASMRHMQNQMQAMQNMVSQQMQAMQAMTAAQHQAQAPQSQPQRPMIPGLDEDDPYFEQFNAVAGVQQQQTTQLQEQVKQLQQSLHNLNMSHSRQNVQNQVESALAKHQVPQELADDVKTTVYAYMASSPNNQISSADHLVGQFMQNLGKYSEVARKKWADEAKKPKPLSVVSATAGIPEDKPGTWDEAKSRSLAMMQAMMSAS